MYYIDYFGLKNSDDILIIDELTYRIHIESKYTVNSRFKYVDISQDFLARLLMSCDSDNTFVLDRLHNGRVCIQYVSASIFLLYVYGYYNVDGIDFNDNDRVIVRGCTVERLITDINFRKEFYNWIKVRGSAGEVVSLNECLFS